MDPVLGALSLTEKHFGNVIAGVPDGQASVGLGLLYELVIGILQQVFKVDQVLQIFQLRSLLPCVTVFPVFQEPLRRPA